MNRYLPKKEQIVARNGLFHLKVTEVQKLLNKMIIILVSFAEMKSKQIRCDVVEIEVIRRCMRHLFVFAQ